MSQSHTIKDSVTSKPYLMEKDFYYSFKNPSDLTVEHYALELLGKKSKMAQDVAKRLFNNPIELGEKLHSYMNTTKKSSQLPEIVALGMN